MRFAPSLACVFCGCAYLFPNVGPAASQQPEAPRAFNPVEYGKPGTYVWLRPDGAQFVLLSGCGGGGGGGPGGVTFGAIFPGDGGQASAPVTVLAGPLTANSYTITVGHGGGSQQSGEATSFTAEGVDEPTYVFAGGAPGSPHISSPLQSTAGANSLYGSGGAAGPNGSSGGTASGLCAGGGGGGMPDKTPWLDGGAGGSGHFLMYVLPSAAR